VNSVRTLGGTTVSVPGAQSLDRAVVLLLSVAAHAVCGVSLSELVKYTGFDRTTARRIAEALAHHGLLARDAETKKYRLGDETMALGMTYMDHAPIVERSRPVMQRLMRITGDTVFLVVRMGDFSYCLHVEEGKHSTHSFKLQKGGARLLGLGVGSIALAARLGVAALDEHYQRYSERYLSHGVSLKRLHLLAARTRSAGYSYASARGVAGVGMWFPVGSCADAALSILGPRSRISSERRIELASLLANELKRQGVATSAHEISQTKTAP